MSLNYTNFHIMICFSVHVGDCDSHVFIHHGGELIFLTFLRYDYKHSVYSAIPTTKYEIGTFSKLWF